MHDGLASKCDGCAATTKAGGVPWCVATCPSSALMYGPRHQIETEAHIRAEALRNRYPHAHVYGETQLGGLGMLVVMPDDPGRLDIPVDPQIPFLTEAWQRVVQPAAVGITLGAVLVAGGAAVVARRRHEIELEELEVRGVFGNGEAKDEQEEV